MLGMPLSLLDRIDAADADTKEHMTLPTDTDTSPAESRPRRQKSGKKTARKVLLGFAAAVLVAGLIGGAYVFNLAQTFNSGTTKIETAFPEESTRPQKTEPINGTAAMNILVMGSDTRGSA